ncbi:MAG: glutamate decarboxylase [Peptococcaceae bacterium]|nr:MAG: glutamate decarboxylase [Peptococcaceae bacterium]
MWTVVYIASGKKEAESIRELLAREGLLVKLREIALLEADSNYSVEVLVSELEVDEAMEIINLIPEGR